MTEKRLIDANELKEKMLNTGWWDNADRDEVALPMVLKAPTVDAEPIKHGHWEYIGGYGYQYRCSNCIKCVERKTRYCPHCGAKMDGRPE